jgi:HlyD family secretion protein
MNRSWGRHSIVHGRFGRDLLEGLYPRITVWRRFGFRPPFTATELLGAWRQAISPQVALVALAALATVGCGNGEDLANPSGTLEATEINVAPLLTARLLDIRADEGDRVAKGDTLLVLDTDLLRRQRTQVAAQDDVLAAQKREAGQLLEQSRRRLELTETTLARTAALHAQGSATQQQVDDLEAQRDVSASQVAAARDRIGAIAAQTEQVAASLAVLDRQLADGIVFSPIAGTVLLRMAEPGEVAMAGAPVLRLADLDNLDLRIYLEETDLDLVRIGEPLPVLVDALEGKELSGVVRWISAEAEFTPKNAQTRSARAQLVYAVKLSVPNPDGHLHIGMPAAARIDGKRK